MLLSTHSGWRSTTSAPSRISREVLCSPSPRGCPPLRAYYLGIDFGTSGARATVIQDEEEIVKESKLAFDNVNLGRGGWCDIWESVLDALITDLGHETTSQVQSIAIDGTSATALLVDQSTGEVLQPAKLYNEAQPQETVALAKEIAPSAHTATASTSTLCKVLTWHLAGQWQQAQSEGHQPVLMHQADWLASLLHGQRDVTDWNNALKVGYDPAEERYPAWLVNQPFSLLLPARVYPPGYPVAPVLPEVAKRLGLPEGCMVCAGTTDSIAAFIAAGVDQVGQAVTSLGSTMAVKLLSDTPVEDASRGVYSHRLGQTWLVGGASNTGGAVLKKFFTTEQLRQLSSQMDVQQSTGLDYYPLPAPGERFPINDPNMMPRLEPRPEDDVRFLQGMFEGMASIEATAYQLLRSLGASPVQQVTTAGGGAVNPQWTAIRQKYLGVPVRASTYGEASYGAARLARGYAIKAK